MNAAPEYFMREPPKLREPPRLRGIASRDAGNDASREDQHEQRFWQWFAVGVLVFCWIAEASMCAMRGF